MSLYCKGENCPKSNECLRAEEYRNYVKKYGIPKDGEDIGMWLVGERKCVDEGYTEGVFSKKEPNMSKAREKALEAFPISFSERMGYRSDTIPNERRNAFEKGYEQAIKDIKETFEEMSKNTNCAIDAVKVLGSLLDNPDIRKKLGNSKPIPKRPIKTNPFFGGDKK